MCYSARVVFRLLGRRETVAFHPIKFFEEVKKEGERVTWPNRRATLVTTGAVLAMVSVASIFFFVVDQLVGLALHRLFGLGG